MGFLVFDAVDLQCPAISAGRLKVTGAALRFRSRSERLLRVFVSNWRQMDKAALGNLSRRLAMRALARARAEIVWRQSAPRTGVRLYQSELFVAGFGYLSDGGVSIGHLDPRLRM